MHLHRFTPRSLFRLMLELGELTLGVIVTTAGLAIRFMHRRCRITLEIGGQALPALGTGA